MLPRMPHSKLDVTQPFTRAAGLAAGLTPRELRTAKYRRIFQGVYIAADVRLTPLARVRAALLTVPSPSFASHASAARVDGVPIPVLPDEHVTVLRQRDRRSRPGIVCHYARTARVRTVDGIRLSSAPQMFCELAALLPLVEVVVAGDWLVRNRRASRPALVDAAAGRTGSGAALARVATRYVRASVDSPMETRLRMLLVLAGLPEPRINVPLRDPSGAVIRRYDLSYPSVKVAIEYDGREHIDREQQWEADLARREAGENEGWRILVVTSRGIYGEPERTLRRVHTLLRERGLPGVPRTPNEAWRTHFPGR
jgi:hypothetical protein